MKNFIFKSSQASDLLKIISLLESIQTELRHNRFDNQSELDQLRTIVKGLALLVSAPERNDSPTLDDFGKLVTEDLD